ncbi:Ig-like domain-containing protein [Ureibacillus composti]|nr:Ig-like domain-containing protein [Ureibacillus composti]
MKKIMSIMIIVLLLFTQSTVYAQIDVEIPDMTPDLQAPFITQINVSNNELTPTTSIKVIADISDELSGFNNGSITYRKPNNQTKTVSFILNSISGKYEALISVPEIDVAGEWKATSIYLEDNKENYIYLSNLSKQSNGEEIDLSKLNLIVSGVNSPPEPTDKEAPLLNLISVNSQEVTINEKIELVAEVTDNESGVSTVRADYRLPSGKSKSIILRENANGQFVGSYTIGKYDESGEWVLSTIYVNDNAGNSRTSTSYLDSNGNEMNFENCNFIVSGTIVDSEAPVLQDISVTSQIVRPNEKIEVRVKATDNESGVVYVRVNYKKPNGSTGSMQLVRNTLGEFIGSLTVSQYEERGKFTITSVYMEDLVGNRITALDYIDSEDNIKDFSHCEVEITGTTPDWEGPEFIGGNISKSQFSPTQVAVKLVITVEDKLSGITYSSLSGSYKKPSGRLYYLNFSKVNNEFTATILLDKFDEMGVWELESLSIRDAVGNYTRPTKVGANPLSEFNINVMGKVTITPGTYNSILLKVPESLNGGLSYQLQPVLKSSNSDVADKDITQDTKTEYSSSNSKLLTINSNGLMTVPDDAGSGYVTVGVSYGDVSKEETIKINGGNIDSFLEVSPLQVTLHSGKTEQIKVVEIYDGARKDVTNSSSGVTYTSSNPTLVTVTKDGLIEAVSNDEEGTVEIYVTYNNKEAKSTVKLTKPSIQSLLISPLEEELSLKNNKLQLVVKAIMTDGTTIDVTKSSTGTRYVSSNVNRATIDENGLISVPAETSHGSETVTITAINNNIKVESRLKINGPPFLDAIDLRSSIPTTLERDSSYQISDVLANWSDGTQTTVTSGITYESSDTNKITVSPTGLIEAVPGAIGSSYISVRYEGKSIRTLVALEDPITLESIELSDTIPTTLAQDGTQQIPDIFANWSDGRQTTVTSGITYESSDTNKITVSPTGLVEPVSGAIGSAYISVKYAGKSIRSLVTLETPPTPLSIELSEPIPATITQGESYQIKDVYVNWSNGMQSPVTAGITYESSAPTKLTVSSTGLIEAVPGSIGSSYISVKYEGKSIRTLVALETPPTPLSIELSELIPATIPQGESYQIKDVLVNWSNGTQTPVTTGITYESSAPTKLTVSSTGLIEAVSGANGSSYISVRYGGKSLRTLVALEAPPTPLSIELTEPIPATIPQGESYNIKDVLVNWSNGTQTPVTTGITYESSAPTKLTVSSTGLIEAVSGAIGSSYISVKYEGKSIRTLVALEAPPTPLSIELSEPIPATIPHAGNYLIKEVLVNWSNGTQTPVTTGITYESSAPTKLTVSPTGLIEAIPGAIGSSYISVKYEGKSIRTLMALEGPPTPLSIELSESLPATIPQGGNYQIKDVLVNWSNGIQTPVTTGITYESSAPTKLTVSSTGLIEALPGVIGSAYIYVKYGGKSYRSLVRIND